MGSTIKNGVLNSIKKMIHLWVHRLQGGRKRSNIQFTRINCNDNSHERRIYKLLRVLPPCHRNVLTTEWEDLCAFCNFFALINCSKKSPSEFKTYVKSDNVLNNGQRSILFLDLGRYNYDSIPKEFLSEAWGTKPPLIENSFIKTKTLNKRFYNGLSGELLNCWNCDMNSSVRRCSRVVQDL